MKATSDGLREGPVNLFSLYGPKLQALIGPSLSSSRSALKLPHFSSRKRHRAASSQRSSSVSRRLQSGLSFESLVLQVSEELPGFKHLYYILKCPNNGESNGKEHGKLNGNWVIWGIILAKRE